MDIDSNLATHSEKIDQFEEHIGAPKKSTTSEKEKGEASDEAAEQHFEINLPTLTAEKIKMLKVEETATVVEEVHPSPVIDPK